METARHTYAPHPSTPVSMPPSHAFYIQPPVMRSSSSSSSSLSTSRCDGCYQPYRANELRIHPIFGKARNDNAYYNRQYDDAIDELEIDIDADHHSPLTRLRVCETCRLELIAECSLTAAVASAFSSPNPIDPVRCHLCGSGDASDDTYVCDVCDVAYCMTCLTYHYGRSVASQVKQQFQTEDAALAEQMPWICFLCEADSPYGLQRARPIEEVPRWRQHNAVADIVSDIGALHPRKFINPFTLTQLVPGMTYHTLMHPAARDAMRRSRDGVVIGPCDARDVEVRCLAYPSEYLLQSGSMINSKFLPLCQPAIPVSLPDEYASLLPNTSPLSSSSASPSRRPLERIVSTCIYRMDGMLGTHDIWKGRSGDGNEHPMKYLYGLLVMVRNFHNRFPAEENWKLRIYYDQSLSLPCPCQECVQRRKKGLKDLYPLPEAWAEIKAHLETLPYVQLRFFNWPCYQYCTTEAPNLFGYHLGHVGMMARFLALADLGHTAELVLLSDLDGMWTSSMKAQLDRMMSQKSACLRFQDTDYPVYLWGGASAFAYHPSTPYPLTFPGIEVTIHEFASWHMASPDLITQHEIIRAHWRQYTTNQDLELQYTLARQELKQLGVLDSNWTDEQCLVEYTRRLHTEDPNHSDNSHGDSRTHVELTEIQLRPSSQQRNAKKKRRSLNLSKSSAASSSTRTNLEKLHDLQATEDDFSRYFPYAMDQAFLFYFVWPTIQQYEALTNVAIQSIPSSVSSELFNESPLRPSRFIHTIPVKLPQANKIGVMRITFYPTETTGRVLAFSDYLGNQPADRPQEENILPYTRQFIKFELGREWAQNQYRPLKKVAPTTRELLSRQTNTPPVVPTAAMSTRDDELLSAASRSRRSRTAQSGTVSLQSSFVERDSILKASARSGYTMMPLKRKLDEMSFNSVNISANMMSFTPLTNFFEEKNTDPNDKYNTFNGNNFNGKLETDLSRVKQEKMDELNRANYPVNDDTRETTQLQSGDDDAPPTYEEIVAADLVASPTSLISYSSMHPSRIVHVEELDDDDDSDAIPSSPKRRRTLDEGDSDSDDDEDENDRQRHAASRSNEIINLVSPSSPPRPSMSRLSPSLNSEHPPSLFSPSSSSSTVSTASVPSSSVAIVFRNLSPNSNETEHKSSINPRVALNSLVFSSSLSPPLLLSSSSSLTRAAELFPLASNAQLHHHSTQSNGKASSSPIDLSLDDMPPLEGHIVNKSMLLSAGALPSHC